MNIEKLINDTIDKRFRLQYPRDRQLYAAAKVNFKHGMQEVLENPAKYGLSTLLPNDAIVKLQELYDYIGTANRIKREDILQSIHDIKTALTCSPAKNKNHE